MKIKLPKRVSPALFVSCLAPLLLLGCSTRAKLLEVPAITTPHRVVELGESVEGRRIDAFALGDGPFTVMVIAGIHGNEAAGVPLVRRLLEREANDNPDLLAGRTLVVVPHANPDGLLKNRRTNVNGVDLNRNFPAENFKSRDRHGEQPLSQPEARAIMVALDTFQPDRIISIHQPIGCIDWDNPAAEPVARAMADACDLPAKKVGSRPGSLGSYAGLDRNIEVITPELRRDADGLTTDELWHHYGPMLLAGIKHETSNR